MVVGPCSLPGYHDAFPQGHLTPATPRRSGSSRWDKTSPSARRRGQLRVIARRNSRTPVCYPRFKRASRIGGSSADWTSLRRGQAQENASSLGAHGLNFVHRTVALRGMIRKLRSVVSSPKASPFRRGLAEQVDVYFEQLGREGVEEVGSVAKLMLRLPLVQEVINAMPIPVSVLNEKPLRARGTSTCAAMAVGSGGSESPPHGVLRPPRPDRPELTSVRDLSASSRTG